MIASSLLVPSCTVFDDLTYTPDAGGAGTPDAETYAKAVLADGPIAFWRFEDGTSAVVRDSSGRANDCEYVGGVGRGRPSANSVLGTAIDLDGTTKAYALCHDVPFDFAATAPFTVEAWIHPRTADSVYRKVFSKDDSDGPRSGWNLSVVSPNNVRFERFSADKEICGIRATIRTNAWSHLVGVFDGSTIHLYVDGGAIHERAQCGAEPMADTAAALVLGAQSDTSYGFFDGMLDELAVYDRALGADRIAAHRDAVR